MIHNIKPCLSFDDVQILDNINTLDSRSEVSLTQYLSGCECAMNLPVFTASMDTVTSLEMAKAVLGAGAGVVHHRYCSVSDRYHVIDQSNDDKWWGVNGVAIGIGETEVSRETIDHLLSAGVELISLDVAACFHRKVADVIEAVAPVLKAHGVTLMVGNFSNHEFIEYLDDRRVLQFVDLLKVSQGGGSVCTTRMKTGIGKPTFQAVYDCYLELQKERYQDLETLPKIVADGGLRTPGDIVKALGAGANYVMLGSMLAGTDESPGQIIEVDGRRYKQYQGMASKEAKEGHFEVIKNVEGVAALVPYKGSVKPILQDIKEGIQSGIATAGFKSLSDFVGNAQFIRVTSAGQREALPHARG